ncbi:MAG: alpha/beta hydrolase [Actinobacteria bacterium]|nr:alpha/beta hydrolase [Actinomycetota bacterium]
MTVTLLIHGVPETPAIWHELAPRLPGDVRALQLPGFGCGLPDGFTATMDEYREWLVAAIESIGEPVNVVGHDWGGILVAGVALDPPANLRSWTTDAIGAVFEKFTWHDLAMIWRTPEAGEAFWTDLLADRAAAAEVLTSFSLTLDHAQQLIEHVDDTMIDAILRLYRSSDGLGSGWLASGRLPKPGLVVVAADDALGDVELTTMMAQRTGAELAVLDHGGHFWPIENPEGGADAIASFHASLA